jgi:hypothetical protein
MAIIVKMVGGLGNQMFQYALARRLTSQLNTELFLDTSYYQQVHNVFQCHPFCIHEFNIKFDTPIAPISLDFNVYEEKSLAYDGNVLNIKDNTFLVGYWQNIQYVAPYKNVLVREFVPKNLVDLTDVQKVKDIIESSSNATALHIRGGDYRVLKNFDVVNKSYYERAIDLLMKKVGGATFFIFSNDDDYVTQLLENKLNSLDISVYRIKFSAILDVHLMSLCKYFIIPNSSFSWWGSFLSTKNGFTIAPSRWLNNNSTINLTRPDMILMSPERN